MSNYNSFGARLKQERERQGITQKELSKRSGIAPATLSSYEQKGNLPSLENAVKIADTLKISLDWLTGRTKPTNYESIRSMSIDELAEYMYHYWDAPFCKNKPQCAQLLDAPGGIPDESCIQCARKWLMQEVVE